MAAALGLPRNRIREWRDGQRRELDIGTVLKLRFAAMSLGSGEQRLFRTLRAPKAGRPTRESPEGVIRVLDLDRSHVPVRVGLTPEEWAEVERASRNKRPVFIRNTVGVTQDELDRLIRKGWIGVKREPSPQSLAAPVSGVVAWVTSNLTIGEFEALPRKDREILSPWLWKPLFDAITHAFPLSDARWTRAMHRRAKQG